MIALAFILVLTFSAQDWNRTSTSLRMADFESAASTNSATWAKECLKGSISLKGLIVKATMKTI